MKTSLLILIILCQFNLNAGEYAVICDKQIEALSVDEIRAIFLKKLHYANGIKTVPINLGVQSNVRRAFEKEVLGMSFSRLKSYWTKQHYLGHRPPTRMKSQRSVISFVTKIEGAISYIEIKNAPSDIHIIYKWSD